MAMAHKVHVEYAWVAYRVMRRGKDARHNYDGDRDRKLWLETSGEAFGDF